jgi:hypothetical protein
MDFLFAIVAIVVALVVFGLLVTGVVLMVRDTVRKRGRWGINTGVAVCRQCGTTAPVIRKPANFNQMMWGGWTCAECGLELDRWGEPVADQPFPAKWSARLDDKSADPPGDTRTRKAREDLHRGGSRD